METLEIPYFFTGKGITQKDAVEKFSLLFRLALDRHDRGLICSKGPRGYYVIPVWKTAPWFHFLETTPKERETESAVINKALEATCSHLGLADFLEFLGQGEELHERPVPGRPSPSGDRRSPCHGGRSPHG